MTDEESKKLLHMVEAHAGRLREQGFDSVQIFCTKFDGNNGTRTFGFGSGNYHARVGQVSLWLKNENSYEEERGRIQARDDFGG